MPDFSLTDERSLPRVQTLARRAQAVSPDTAYTQVCELLRVSPYRVLAVVEQTGQDAQLLTGPLIGIVTEKSIADRLLDASPEEQDQLRRTGTAWHVYQPIVARDCAIATDSAVDASDLFNRTGRDAAPVISLGDTPYYLGMVSRADLVRDLHRAFAPPMVGGMATPIGVYLTTGSISGGVGTLALATTGMMTLVLHLTGVTALAGITYLLHRYVPIAANLPEIVFVVLQTALFLALMRQTPLAGYHAAEHQVVHAIERGEPLLIDVVRTMPRVHPRCSTNLVAGVLLFYTIGFGLSGWQGAEVSYLLGGLAAFLWWKPFGSFLQQYATTRPATDKQIASGIRAAKELFQAMDTPIDRPTPRLFQPFAAKWRRVWYAGFLQIFLGSGIGVLLLWLASLFYPPLGTWLNDLG